MSDDSRVLAERAARGDEHAVGEILERHLPALRFYVRVKASPALLEREHESDIVQSVCLELLEHAASFEFRGEAAFRQWLFTAALRKLVEKDRYWNAGKRDAKRLAGVDRDDGTGLIE